MSTAISPLRHYLRTALMLAGALIATPVIAQTAHVNYGQSTIGFFQGPAAVAVDAAGNVYVADSAHNSYMTTIYKETPAGSGYTQTTVATFAGEPFGMAIDASNNLYITAYTFSTGNIFKETLSGGTYIQSTIATNINALGIVLDSAGDLFYTDESANTVVEEKLAGGVYTPATIATGFNYPIGLGIDATGNLYVADQNNNRVVKETLSGGAYTASTIGSGWNAPQGVVADTAGNVYVTDSNTGVLVKETLSGGTYTATTITSLVYGGNNAGMALDAMGAIYFTSYAPGGNSFTIFKETPLEGANVPTINFSSSAVNTATAPQTATFTFDVGGTLAAKPYSVVTQGDPTLDFQAASTQAATACITGHTYSVGDTCTVAVIFTPLRPGTRYGAVKLLGSDGSTIAVAYMQGSGTGPMVGLTPFATSLFPNLDVTHPTGMVADSSGNLFWFNYPSNYFEAKTSTGAIEKISGTSGTPAGLALDSLGNLIVADDSDNDVYILPQTGSYDTATVIANGLDLPSCVAVDGSGNVYIADTYNNRVLKETYFDESYTQSVIGTGLKQPGCVAVDSKGNVFINDTNNSRVLEEAFSGGAYTQTVLSTNVSFPTGLTVDPFDNVFIADDGNHRILKETLSGATYTESTYLSGFFVQGDIGYLTIDPDGNLFVTTSSVNSGGILEYTVQRPPAFNFADTNIGSTSTDSPKTTTITNLGNAPLLFTVPASGTNPVITPGFQVNASSTCPQLSITSTAGSLAPGASCIDNISFVPVASGITTGTLTQTDNNLYIPGSTQIVASLGGNGLGTGSPQATLTPSASFGSVQTGTTATLTLTLTNAGTAALPITSYSITAGNPPFTQTATTCTSSLAAGGSCTFTITFTPNATGIQTGSFSVTDSVGTQTASLTGTGTAPAAPNPVLTPPSLSFVNVLAGATSTAMNATLNNTGNASLAVSSITIQGTNATSFSETNTCGTSVAAGGSCNIAVTCSPSSSGTFTATMFVNYPSPLPQQNVALTCAATTTITPADFAVTASPATQSAFRGTTVTYAIALTSLLSSNPFSNAVTLTATGLPAGATATFSPATVTPGGSGATSNLSIAAPALTSTLHPDQTSPWHSRSLPCLSFATLAFCLCFKRRRTLHCRLLTLLVLAGLAFTMTGCGDGNGFATPVTTSTITVTATSGSTIHTTTVTLTLK